MPLLDVSPAILDPNFLDEMQLTRFAQTIGANGRAINAPTTVGLWGVVTNDKGDLLKRTSDAGQILGSITVHTITKLSAGTATTEADIITWDGNTYTVESVGNYSRYGGGFTMNTCAPTAIQGGT